MTSYAIIASVNDAAGLNIKARLAENYGFVPCGGEFEGSPVLFRGRSKIYTLGSDTMYAEGLDERVEGDVLIFATRHQAESGTATLTVHTPGNFGQADFGGSPGEICISAPRLMKAAMKKLEAYNDIGSKVSMEVTHHGPRLSRKPVMFIEIGSASPQWADERAGRVIARVISELVEEDPMADNAFAPAVGIGGPHYCASFNKFADDPGLAVGHVCPKYHVERLDARLIAMMAERTSPPARTFLIDWKGVPSEPRARIIADIERMGHEYRRV